MCLIKKDLRYGVVPFPYLFHTLSILFIPQTYRFMRNKGVSEVFQRGLCHFPDRKIVNAEEGCRHLGGLTECLWDQYAGIHELTGKVRRCNLRIAFSSLGCTGAGKSLDREERLRLWYPSSCNNYAESVEITGDANGSKTSIWRSFICGKNLELDSWIQRRLTRLRCRTLRRRTGVRPALRPHQLHGIRCRDQSPLLSNAERHACGGY